MLRTRSSGSVSQYSNRRCPPARSSCSIKAPSPCQASPRARFSTEAAWRPESHPTYRRGVPRVKPATERTNALEGDIKMSPAKQIWFSGLVGSALAGSIMTFDPAMIATDLSVFFVSSGVSILFGHSLGMHRRLIHKSYKCPKWLEYFLVHLGTVMGIAGPLSMIRAHDLRDWAQRQPPGQCHTFFSQQEPFLRDSHWQMCCSLHLKHPPDVVYEPEVGSDPVYRWMEKYWREQQLPWVVLFYLLGGVHWVVWGVLVRTAVSMYGHFLVGWFAHNEGPWADLRWEVKGSAVQGQNVLGNSRLLSTIAALFTGGESYHNNHHAFPGSARLSQSPGEIDLGYCVLRLMERAGLVWDIRLPKDLPSRPELRKDH